MELVNNEWEGMCKEVLVALRIAPISALEGLRKTVKVSG
jgi:hypothetical protein